MGNVFSIGYSIGLKAVEGINAGAGNASPSKKTFQSGLFTDEGFYITTDTGDLIEDA